jgi:RING finger/CHY zinc finger protein 1
VLYSVARSVCNLFDDEGEQKEIFHCEGCGICRVGGKEPFFHCDTCKTCYNVSLRDNHKCVDGSMHHNCPVCQDFLFDSREACHIMVCGHTIHNACFQGLLNSGHWTCPLCSATLFNMSSAFDSMREVRARPHAEEARAVARAESC